MTGSWDPDKITLAGAVEIEGARADLAEAKLRAIRLVLTVRGEPALTIQRIERVLSNELSGTEPDVKQLGPPGPGQPATG